MLDKRWWQVLVLAVCMFLCTSCARSTPTHSETIFAMDTVMTITVNSEDA